LRLPIDTALRILDEAKEVGIHSFQIAGGEPTLYEDFMVEVIAHGKKLSMKAHRPPTNCYIAKDTSRMRRFFSRLADIGFAAGFRISCDRFHKAIAPELIADFIINSSDFFKLDRFSIGCCDINEARSIERLGEVVSHMNENGFRATLHSNKLETEHGTIKIGFWAPTRPTWKNVPDDEFIFRSVDPCLSAVKSFEKTAPISRFGCLGPEGVGYLWIEPDGSVRACCGNANIFIDELKIGNAAHENIKDILKKAMMNEMLSALASGGPIELAEMSGFDLDAGCKYTHRCELCFDVFRKAEKNIKPDEKKL